MPSSVFGVPSLRATTAAVAARPPIAFAHRGARAHAPENTLEAFALALRLGATGLESDVWLTADGVPVLDHDGVVRSVAGDAIARPPCRPGPAARAHPPLTDLFERVRHRLPPVARPQARRGRAVVIDVVARRAPSCSPASGCASPTSTDSSPAPPRPRRQARRLDPPRPDQGGAERRAATLAAEGIDAVNLHHTDWTAG